MSRWSHFVANVGGWAAFRTVLIAVVFAYLAIVMLRAEGSPVLLIAYALGAGVPYMLRDAIVGRLAATFRALRIASFSMIGFGVLATMVRGRSFGGEVLWEEGSAIDVMMLPVLTLVLVG